jgi:creatinine amidohydrolase
MQVLRAPTIEYGVNSPTKVPYPGSASVRPKTLHRFLNDLVGSWEAGGVEEFIIITAHGQDPHQEALSTLRTRRAAVRTVDIFAAPLEGTESEPHEPIHGGEVDTSLMLYVDADLVDLDAATDYHPQRRTIKRYQRGIMGAIPQSSPGSLGSPTLANVEKGEDVYGMIYERIAERVFRHPVATRGAR